MMPFWIYTLGTVFSTQAQITIPILGLSSNLIITIVPCLIGFFLSQKFPKLKMKALKIAKPLTLVVLITFLLFSFIVKMYTYRLLSLRHLCGIKHFYY